MFQLHHDLAQNKDQTSYPSMLAQAPFITNISILATMDSHEGDIVHHFQNFSFPPKMANVSRQVQKEEKSERLVFQLLH